MKVKVIKWFVDRETKDLREEGKIYTYSTERADELIKGNYVVDVKEPDEKK